MIASASTKSLADHIGLGLDDPAIAAATVQELFAQLVRMNNPGGSQPVEWAVAFEEIGEPGLARELFQAALAKIEAGGYGECDECGVDIPYARLKIEPATQHCVDCKSRWERETGAVPASNM